jgi:hypothetical protein
LAELLDGKGIDYPAIAAATSTFKRAQRVKKKAGDQLSLTEE